MGKVKEFYIEDMPMNALIELEGDYLKSNAPEEYAFAKGIIDLSKSIFIHSLKDQNSKVRHSIDDLVYSSDSSIKTISEVLRMSNELTYVFHNMLNTLMERNYNLGITSSVDTKPTKKQTFTTKEAMEIIGIKSKDTMIKYLNNGTIKAHKQGNTWVIKRSDLSEYVKRDDF